MASDARTISITTPRLILRTMRPDDSTALHVLFGDPVFMQAFQRPPFSFAQTEAWVARNVDHQLEHGFGLFTIVLRETDEIIGDCGFEVMLLDGETETELGYDLAARHWGRGLATEAAQAASIYAFETLGLVRLFSLVRSGNTRSARVAEKIGMRRVRSVERSGVDYEVYALDSHAR